MKTPTLPWHSAWADWAIERTNERALQPYDPYAGEGARERYLRWEIDLVHQIEREGDVGFRVAG
jgi:hypothetical protein